MYKCGNFGSMSSLPVSQVQIAGYAYQINYLAYLIEKLQKDVANLDPEDQGEAISTLQAAVAEIQEEIESLETGGGNAYTLIPTLGDPGANQIRLSFADLPDGAVIDKIECIVNTEGGTVPVKFEVDVYAGGLSGESVGTGNGYALWTLASVSSGGTTTLTIALSSTNTLYTHVPAVGDSEVWARIYYHV